MSFEKSKLLIRERLHQLRWRKVHTRIFSLIIVPPILTCILYPLHEPEIFHLKEHQSADFNLQQDLFEGQPTSWRSVIADILETPLHLDWYTVTLYNKSTSAFTNCISVNPSLLFLKFNEGSRIANASLHETATLRQYAHHAIHYPYYLPTGESASFTTQTSKDVSIENGYMTGGGCGETMPSTEQIPVYKYDLRGTFQPYAPTWFAKLLVLYALCISLFASYLSIRAWLREK